MGVLGAGETMMLVSKSESKPMQFIGEHTFWEHQHLRSTNNRLRAPRHQAWPLQMVIPIDKDTGRESYTRSYALNTH